MVKMKAPETNKSGAGFGGEFFPIDEKGCVTVPAEAVAALQGHGFIVAEDTLPPTGDQDKRPNVADTLVLIKDAADMEALNKLAEGEDRATVTAAIEKRRAALTLPPTGDQE